MAKKKDSQSTLIPVIPPRLLTIQQAASYLSTTVWAVRTLAWNRGVPSIRIGKRILLDRADLDAYIDQQKRSVA